jgi:cobalamin synthase
MTKVWVQGQRTSRHWPILGTLVGSVCAFFFWQAMPFFLPVLALGIYLAYFHLFASEPL